MRKLIAACTVMIATGPALFAGGGDHGWDHGWGHGWGHHHAPEINPATGLAALILIAGAVLILRGQRKVQS